MDKPAEYRSPPGKRLNAKAINDPNQQKKAKEKPEKSVYREESVDKARRSESFDIVDLSNMSSEQLADHVEGLRNTVRRLQESECSFIKQIEGEENGIE